jgi:sugar phosphate isomerase/epimerase
MQLGIIAEPNEDSFRMASQNGLDFLEFCINEGHDTEGFYNNRGQLKIWLKEYGVQIGSIGRWKAQPLDGQGKIIGKELQTCYKLIDAASELKCTNFVCGCNYVDNLSYFENCAAAIQFFSMLIEYAGARDVKISTYNCRSGNFVHHPDAWKMVHGHLPELGIKYDPSHSRYAGGDYLQETLDWGNRFNHIHLKGSMIINGKRIDDPPVGLDQTDWKLFISLLRVKGYTGGLSIEPHSSVWTGEWGEKGIHFTIDYMKKLLFKDGQ